MFPDEVVTHKNDCLHAKICPLSCALFDFLISRVALAALSLQTIFHHVSNPAISLLREGSD